MYKYSIILQKDWEKTALEGNSSNNPFWLGVRKVRKIKKLIERANFFYVESSRTIYYFTNKERLI